jgi:murein endopeptidase
VRGLARGSLACALAVAAALVWPAPPAGDGQAPRAQAPSPAFGLIHWRRSVALGLPFEGRLVRGVQLPSEGQDYFTWDPVLERPPNRPWRRWGTDRLVAILLRVLRDYRTAHPEAPRVGVADLSRRRGGPFGRRYGGLGHASHQNGLDVDVFYPRRDHRERRPSGPRQVDLRLSQDLVSRFVRAGAKYVFVGTHLPLRGRRRRVQPLAHHDDHMHVRISPRDRR